MEVHCLPKLVNGKVAVINNDNTYSLYNPSVNTVITDNYNPLDYCILVHAKYNKCIIHSCKKDREFYLVNSQLAKVPIYRLGDNIHIHSRRGIYELVKIEDNFLYITCKKWQKYDVNSIHKISKNDFSALAGGIYNTPLF